MRFFTVVSSIAFLGLVSSTNTPSSRPLTGSLLSSNSDREAQINLLYSCIELLSDSLPIQTDGTAKALYEYLFLLSSKLMSLDSYDHIQLLSDLTKSHPVLFESLTKHNAIGTFQELRRIFSPFLSTLQLDTESTKVLETIIPFKEGRCTHCKEDGKSVEYITQVMYDLQEQLSSDGLSVCEKSNCPEVFRHYSGSPNQFIVDCGQMLTGVFPQVTLNGEKYALKTILYKRSSHYNVNSSSFGNFIIPAEDKRPLLLIYEKSTGKSMISSQNGNTTSSNQTAISTERIYIYLSLLSNILTKFPIHYHPFGNVLVFVLKTMQEGKSPAGAYLKLLASCVSVGSTEQIMEKLLNLLPDDRKTNDRMLFTTGYIHYCSVSNSTTVKYEHPSIVNITVDSEGRRSNETLNLTTLLDEKFKYVMKNSTSNCAVCGAPCKLCSFQSPSKTLIISINRSTTLHSQQVHLNIPQYDLWTNSEKYSHLVAFLERDTNGGVVFWVRVGGFGDFKAWAKERSNTSLPNNNLENALNRAILLVYKNKPV